MSIVFSPPFSVVLVIVVYVPYIVVVARGAYCSLPAAKQFPVVVAVVVVAVVVVAVVVVAVVVAATAVAAVVALLLSLSLRAQPDS